jgi:hypothetical protein
MQPQQQQLWPVAPAAMSDVSSRSRSVVRGHTLPVCLRLASASSHGGCLGGSQCTVHTVYHTAVLCFQQEGTRRIPFRMLAAAGMHLCVTGRMPACRVSSWRDACIVGQRSAQCTGDPSCDAWSQVACIVGQKTSRIMRCSCHVTSVPVSQLSTQCAHGCCSQAAQHTRALLDAVTATASCS